MKCHPSLKIITTSLMSLLLISPSFAQSIASAQNTNATEISVEDVQRFSNAVHHIKQFYVEDIEDEELFDDAIRGMLTGLDPHSSYLDEDDFRELKIATQGQFGGLGIEVTMENGVIKVVSPIDDSPASRAGLQSGDYIVRLDEAPVKGMTLPEAINKMRGEKGSKIALTILREGEAEPINVELIRDIIKVKSVTAEMLDDGYGYLRISQFQASTADSALKEIKKLQKQANGKLKGLVLDLRNNPGGLLDSAVQLSDMFIHNDQKDEEELIVYTEGRIPGTNYTISASPGDVLNGAPIVVLINEGSASGSEIVAGALQDNDRALLVGTRSFGKGSVQTIIPLDEDHGIKLTTALYYTPSGDSIQAEGIVPDIIINALQVTAAEANPNIITEADLLGHLDNHDEVEETAINIHQDDLAYTDYQLYAALNLLRGLVLIQE